MARSSLLRSSYSLRRAGRTAPGVRAGRIACSTRPSPYRPAFIRDGLSCRSRHAPEPYPALEPCLLPALLRVCGLTLHTATPDVHALLSNKALRAVEESTVMQNEHAMTVVRDWGRSFCTSVISSSFSITCRLRYALIMVSLVSGSNVTT